MQNKHHNFLMWVSKPPGRGGGVKTVGTKSQVWQRKFFLVPLTKLTLQEISSKYKHIAHLRKTIYLLSTSAYIGLGENLCYKKFSVKLSSIHTRTHNPPTQTIYFTSSYDPSFVESFGNFFSRTFPHHRCTHVKQFILPTFTIQIL